MLLLSDVIRSGVAIRSMNSKMVEPNSWLAYGPWNHSAASRIHVNDSSANTATVWLYKFDTTSIALRSVAQHFRLSTWPPCLFYQETCESTTLSSTSVFGMLEALVDAVSPRKPQRPGDDPNVILRTADTFRDRLHDYVLIPLFNHPRVRTVQGLYYSPNRVHSGELRFCKGHERKRPFACSDNWTNFRNMCSGNDGCTANARSLWAHASARLQSFKEMYAGMQLDLLLLESHEDIGHAHLSFQGRQYFDVTVITRVRNCSMEGCTTIVMDDYRYESASLTSDVVDWYSVVASLRMTGQAYAWLHLLLLFLCCYHARLAEAEFKAAKRSTVVRAALRTMFTCPSQVVMYGSVFPVLCYCIAHLLDCNMVYEIVAGHFITVAGIFHLDFQEFVKFATISVRSVWVLSLVLHGVLFIRTKCCWAATTKGIPGIPEFSVSVIASLTIGAEYRALAFRNTNLIEISEVVLGPRLRTIRSSRYRNSHGFWYLLFMGDNIDFKCLIASTGIVTACSLLIWLFIRILNVNKLMPRYQFTLWPHTLVSYAAGALWSSNAMMVSWNGLVVAPAHDETYRSMSDAVVHPSLDQRIDDAQRTKAKLCTATSSAFVLGDSPRSAQLYKQMASLESRSPEVKATIFLMNITVMTEPILFYNLRWCKGNAISIFRRVRKPDHVVMLPSTIVGSPHILHIDWAEFELLWSIDAAELDWTDLLNCG